MPLLFSASGGALHGIAAADKTEIPLVPSTSYDQPASVQPAVTINASTITAVADVAANDIPVVALSAYRRTETLLSDADPDCKIAWTLVAAIGRVESDHGRTGGNTLDAAGVAKPGIYGIPLDGSRNTATIHDTDDGKLDGDEQWDRAVGPMQFIPGTWRSVAIDSDNNGKRDPQNIWDATAAAGVYLCAGPDDLSTNAGAREAVLRYNHSDAYADKVLAIAALYAKGTFTDPPSVVFAAPPAQSLLMRPVPVDAKRLTEGAPREEPKPSTTVPPAPTTGPETDPVDEPVIEPDPVVEPDPAGEPVTAEPAEEPVTEQPAEQPVTEEPAEEPVPVDPPTPPAPFAGTELEARSLCLASEAFVIESLEFQQCILALLQTGFMP